jgi:hypothetical protein
MRCATVGGSRPDRLHEVARNLPEDTDVPAAPAWWTGSPKKKPASGGFFLADWQPVCNGGLGRNRTGVRGFAVRCMTTLPPGHCLMHRDQHDRRFRIKQNPGGPRFCANPGAGNETRTRDPDLGKVVLYQLSYSRIGAAKHSRPGALVNSLAGADAPPFDIFARHRRRIQQGPERIRALGAIWSGKRDSNSRPRPWQGRALPTELFPHRSRAF